MNDKDINGDSKKIPRGHVPITPQMIRTAVKRLQMRKLYVSSKLIGEYLCTHYPMDGDAKAFQGELMKKLACAVCVSLIAKHGEDSYCLPTLRQEANSLKTMFSAFWKLYQKNIDKSGNLKRQRREVRRRND